MAWAENDLKTIRKLQTLDAALKERFTARETPVELMILALVCREHLLLLGPPGTAKTQLTQRFTQLVEAQGFHYLITRFTEPSELFGPLDLKQFQEGSYRIRTERMLPQAQVVFLDEVFQGNSAILNTLLTLINERVFYNGSERQLVPLVSLFGASNSLPEDPWLQAFSDRFVLRVQVDPVPDERLDDLIEHGWRMEAAEFKRADRSRDVTLSIEPEVSLNDVLKLYRRLGEVNLNPIRAVYAQVIRELRAEGMEISDRRVVKGLKLVAGAAVLRQSDVAALRDLWPLCHLWTRPEEAQIFREVILPRLPEDDKRVRELPRALGDLTQELARLTAEEAGLSSDASIGAHLMALNRLRKEVQRDFRYETGLKDQLEVAIERVLSRQYERETIGQP